MDFRFPTAGLYTGGAVVADTSPLAQMYHQFTMKQMARDEALDDYFRNLNKSINPAGVRNQDIEGLTKKQGEWQQFYQQNKQAIKNPRIDNGKSLTEYQSRYQDMLNYIQQSKNATAVSEDLAKARLDPNKSFMFEDDEVINKIGEHDKPLTDPTHKTLNIQELSIQPKPIDVKEWQAMQKSAAAGLKPSEEVESIDVDPATMDTITTIKKKYSPEDLQAAGNRMKALYQLDRRVRHTADKSLLNAPNAAELNEIYRNVYGRNAETPADLLAAQTIQGLQTEGTVQKRTAGSLEQKKFLERLKQANRKEIVGMQLENWKKKKQIGAAEEALYLDRHLDLLEEEAAKSKGDVNYPKITLNEGFVPVDPIISKAFEKQGAQPEFLSITADGKYRPIYLEYGAKGTKDAGKPLKDEKGAFIVDETLSQPISRQQAKFALSKYTQTAKQRAAEMSSEGKSDGSKTTTAEEIKAKFNIKF